MIATKTEMRTIGGIIGVLALSASVATAQAQDSVTAQKDTGRAESQNASVQQDSARDSTHWGYSVENEAEVQNPQGYRGMERPVNVFPPDSASGDSVAAASATSRVNQMEWQDTAEAKKGGKKTAQKDRTAKAKAREGDTATTTAKDRDSVDIIHQQRQVPPGVGNAPPPYPADSERVWVEKRPSNDSVSVGGADGAE